MTPLDAQPFIVQAAVVAATFALMIFVGRTGLLLLRSLDSLWTATLGSSKMTEADDSRRSIGVPAAYAHIESQLHELGYFPLGAVRRSYPRRGAEIVLHVFWSLDGMTTARFSRAPSHEQQVRFTTWFDDGSVVVTDYPRGEPLRTERIVSQFVRESLAAAHARHQRQADEWSASGRTPQAIDGMAAYLEQQTIFRQQFDPLYGNPHPALLLRLLGATALVVAGTVAIIVGLYAVQPLLVVLALVLTAAAEWGRGRLSARYQRRIAQPPGAADAR